MTREGRTYVCRIGARTECHWKIKHGRMAGLHILKATFNYIVCTSLTAYLFSVSVSDKVPSCVLWLQCWEMD